MVGTQETTGWEYPQKSVGPLAQPAVSLSAQVLAVAPAAEDAVTLWLAKPGSYEAPAPYRPGQFITLTLSLNGRLLYRSYSLCSDGRLDHPWEITVKRAGIASAFLCSQVAPGTLLSVSMPHGAFTLPEHITPTTPLIFIAGGSGITPVYGMLRALAALPHAMRPDVQLHYASHSPEQVIFRRELLRMDPGEQWLRQWHYIATQGHRLTLSAMLKHADTLSARAHWYICAPERFQDEAHQTLRVRGISGERIHSEVFGVPKARAREHARFVGAMGATSHIDGTSAPGVLIAESGVRLDAWPEESLLETLERHNYHPRFGCRVGVCGDCRLRVTKGDVKFDDVGPLSQAERQAGYVLCCVAQPLGEVTLALHNDKQRAASISVGDTPRALRRRKAKVALRLGLLTATTALFLGAWFLTGQSTPTIQQGQPRYTPPAHVRSAVNGFRAV